MKPSFWIKRPLSVGVSVFVALVVSEWLKGHGWQAGVAFSAIWAFISTGIFTGTMVHHTRKRKACPVCSDSTE